MNRKTTLIGAFLVIVAAAVAYFLWYPGRSSAESLLVGCITPLTGDGATYGTATRRGLDLALEQVNSEGGINGKQLRVQCEDDQLDPRIGTNAIRKLVSVDHVPVIVGAFGSSVTLAVAPIAERDRVVLFSASSTADAIKDAGDYVFRNVPTNRGQGDTAARFARSYLQAESGAILEMNNDYGTSLARAFKAEFQRLGGRVLTEESYNEGATDFRAQLTKIRDSGAKFVFFPGHYEESAIILKQAKELGVKATFLGGDGSYSPELIQIAGQAAEGSYYTLMAMDDPSTNAKARQFNEAYRAKYGSEPDVYSAYAYDALLTLTAAIRDGGYTSDGIKGALYKIQFAGATGRTTFDSKGEVNKPFGVYVVKNGAFVRENWSGQ